MSRAQSHWIETSVGQVAAFLTGFPFESAKFSESGILLVRGSNVKRGVLDRSRDISRYWPADEARFRAFRLSDGDIVIAMDGALVGRSYARIHVTDLPAYLVQRVARLRGTGVDQELLYQWVGSDRFAMYVDTVKTHTAIPHISPRDIRDFSILVPADSTEQWTIAHALRSCDELVATLERLIAKKRAIQQGIMHQLITGETRLKGFSDPWAPRRLRDHGTTYGGLVGKAKEDFGVGTSHYVTFLDVIRNTSISEPRLELVAVRPSERQNQIALGDVLFNGSSETPEEVALSAVVNFQPGVGTYLNSFCFGYRLRSTASVSSTYLAYYFRSSSGRAIVSSLAQGATRYNIAKTKLLDLAPLLPSLEEQKAIVSVLTDADAEIAALRDRLKKALAIKAGMMQQLLTGRTRLPIAEAAA